MKAHANGPYFCVTLRNQALLIYTMSKSFSQPSFECLSCIDNYGCGSDAVNTDLSLHRVDVRLSLPQQCNVVLTDDVSKVPTVIPAPVFADKSHMISAPSNGCVVERASHNGRNVITNINCRPPEWRTTTFLSAIPAQRIHAGNAEKCGPMDLMRLYKDRKLPERKINDPRRGDVSSCYDYISGGINRNNKIQKPLSDRGYSLGNPIGSTEKLRDHLEKPLFTFEKAPQIDLQSYFCSENSKMKIRSDITKVIHQLPEIRNGCLLISQNLQSHIFKRWTPMLEYVFSQFDVSIVDEKIAPVNTIKNKVLFHKIKTIFNQNKFKDRTTYMYYDAYTTHILSNGITKEELKNISLLFYRFVLTGGTAMFFLVNECQKKMRGETPTPTEIEDRLGGHSDFDFVFIINPMLAKDQNNPVHYNMVREISKKYIFDILQRLIYSKAGEIFRNKKLLDSIKNILLEHSPQIMIDTDYSPDFVGTVYRQNSIVDNVKNNPLQNRFGTVTSNGTIQKTFDYYQKTFDLIRLLVEFRNVTNPIECMGSKQYKKFIRGELIDVSIEHFDSFRTLHTWKKTNSIIQLNNLYVPNMSGIIHDLEQNVKEDIELGDPKLRKRLKRLKFLNDFACTWPQ